MTDRIVIKRGAKLTLRAELKNADGTAMSDLDADWITSQVRDTGDVVVGELTWTVTAPGVAIGEAETEDWTVGSHRFDIRIARPDGTVYSETLSARVDAAVTQVAP